MTMTVAFFPESYPILMGDVLLSGLETPGKQIHIPTIGNINNVFPEGSGFTIVGLCQKLCILNDKLSVAWSGTLVAARSVIRHLKNVSDGRDFTLDDIMNFWEHEVDKWCKDNLSLIGLIKSGDLINSFGFNYQKLQSERFGHVILSGTGSRAMAKTLARLGPTPQFPSTTNILEKAVSTALIVSTDMLGQELISPEGLLNYFGGGIELISLVKGKFTKVGDITYLFWYVNEDADQGITFSVPETALKFTYFENYLLVRKAEMKPGKGPLEAQCDDSKVHIISSILETFNPNNAKSIPVPSFNSKWTCHFILIRKSDGAFKLRFILDYAPNQKYKVRFIEENNLITRFEFNMDFVHMLRSAASEPE